MKINVSLKLFCRTVSPFSKLGHMIIILIMVYISVEQIIKVVCFHLLHNSYIIIIKIIKSLMIEYKCDQQSKDGTSISVLWKLGPEEVQSKYTDLWWNWSASKWWLLCVRNSIIYYTYFLKLFILFLCYTQQLIVFVAILNSFWIFLLVCSLSEHVLLCDPPPNDTTSLLHVHIQHILT